jgi:DmsE family decaheme c-type cytochrome
MRRQLRGIGPGAWVICVFAVWLAAFITVRAGDSPVVLAGESSPVPQDSPQVAAPAEAYAGNASCLGCHDEQRSGYEDSAHGRAADARTPAGLQGCETCHGPGKAHADAEEPENVAMPNDFTTMAPGAINETCVTCHDRGPHALWDGSAHERRDLSCISCHQMHQPESEGALLLAATETDVCATCHRDKAAKLDRSGHMPLREGKMECSSCHDPHGSTSVKLLQTGDSIAEQCTSCHADKRGPYLWEHAPSRDGCATCHDPHGSSNERMLVTRTPMLCQRCHVANRHPSTIYDEALIATNVRVYARSCVTCHANIHGSNHPSGQFFIR